MVEKTKAPDGETIEQLEAWLADMKKAAAAPPKKHPQRRPRGSRNKPKSVKTDAEGSTYKNNWWNTNRVIMHLFYQQRLYSSHHLIIFIRKRENNAYCEFP
jgi:hypothetical protein